MKRVLVVLALTGSTVLLPTAAFADTTGGVSVVPVFLVGGGATSGSSTVDPAPVVGPPVPLGPYKADKADKVEKADKADKGDAHGPDGKGKDDKHGPDGKDGKHSRDAASGATSLLSSTFDDPALISGGGRTMG